MHATVDPSLHPLWDQHAGIVFLDDWVYSDAVDYRWISCGLLLYSVKQRCISHKDTVCN